MGNSDDSLSEDSTAWISLSEESENKLLSVSDRLGGLIKVCSDSPS